MMTKYIGLESIKPGLKMEFVEASFCRDASKAEISHVVISDRPLEVSVANFIDVKATRHG